MKIAITGKGGVGKTTLASILAHLFAAEGKNVIAVDADPDANLASAFGIPREEAEKIQPITEMTELIQERTGTQKGSMGGIFTLNPKVDDLPEGAGYRMNRILLLVIGKVKEAATGCYCPENVLLRSLLKHLIVKRDDVVILDMEAGIEHLTRGTAESVDAFIVVVEPGQRSIQTANTVFGMARKLGVGRVFVVANKVRGRADMEFIERHIGGRRVFGSISFSPAVMEADMKGAASYSCSGETVNEVREIKKRIDMRLSSDLMKKDLRKKLLRARDQIPPDIREQKDLRIREAVLSLPEFMPARAILLYASFRSEVGTIKLIADLLSMGKRVILPRVDERNTALVLLEIRSLSELSKGYMGIPEPQLSGESLRVADDADIAFIPGAVFDLSGNRLGYGGGYYDILLSKITRKIPVIALAYEEQIVDLIPAEEHDVKVDIIITDARVIRIT